jgi:hypothetical protein
VRGVGAKFLPLAPESIWYPERPEAIRPPLIGFFPSFQLNETGGGGGCGGHDCTAMEAVKGVLCRLLWQGLLSIDLLPIPCSTCTQPSSKTQITRGDQGQCSSVPMPRHWHMSNDDRKLCSLHHLYVFLRPVRYRVHCTERNGD